MLSWLGEILSNIINMFCLQVYEGEIILWFPIWCLVLGYVWLDRLLCPSLFRIVNVKYKLISSTEFSFPQLCRHYDIDTTRHFWRPSSHRECLRWICHSSNELWHLIDDFDLKRKAQCFDVIIYNLVKVRKKFISKVECYDNK